MAASDTKPIMVPAAVAMAISSRRPQFLALAPKTLDEENIAGIYAAMKQLLELLFEKEQRVTVLEDAIERIAGDAGDLVTTTRMAQTQAQRLADRLRKLASADAQEDDGC